MPYSTVCGLISLSLLLFAQPLCIDCISVHVYVQHTFIFVALSLTMFIYLIFTISKTKLCVIVCFSENEL